jgi:predicted DNA-binding protein
MTTKPKPLKLCVFRMSDADISELKRLSDRLGTKSSTLVRSFVLDRLKAS